MSISFKNALNNFTNTSLTEGEIYILYFVNQRIKISESIDGERGFMFGEYVKESHTREQPKYLVKYENDKFVFVEKTESTDEFTRNYGELNKAIFNIMSGYVSRQQSDPEFFSVHLIPFKMCEEMKKENGDNKLSFEDNFKNMKKEFIALVASNKILEKSEKVKNKAEVKSEIKTLLMDIQYDQRIKNSLFSHMPWFDSVLRVSIMMLVEKWFDGEKTKEEKKRIMEEGVEVIFDEYKESVKFKQLMDCIDLGFVGETVMLKPEDKLIMKNRERLNAIIFNFPVEKDNSNLEEEKELKLKI